MPIILTVQVFLCPFNVQLYSAPVLHLIKRVIYTHIRTL